MKLKVVFPIAFSLLLSAFTAYSVLDTLVLESGDVVLVDSDDDGGFTFTPKPIEEDKPNENNNPGGENPGGENPGGETPGGENPGGENPGGENPGGNETPSEQPTERDYLYTFKNEDLNIKIFKETIKTKHMTKDKMMDTIVFCADVTVSDLSHFRTRFAKGHNSGPSFGRNITDKTSDIAVDGNAKFAINGDYYGAREKGYVVRNGKTYRETAYSSSRDDLVVWGDGSFGSFDESETPLSEITSNPLGAWQVFSFGPTLVKNSQVSVDVDAEVTTFSTLGNQRCSIGIYEPLHYFIAICEGRLSDSYGMSLYEMGTFMAEKGVKTAYNLDGGGSATMWYDGKVLNRPNTNGDNDIKEREISDIILFR